MFRFFVSPAWSPGPARPLALVLCVSVALVSQACATTRFTDDPALAPQPFRAGLVVRVFDTSDDARAGRLTTRDVTSVVEDDQGVVYEARGAEWSLDDADPGRYRLTVRYGTLPGSPNGAVVDRQITLVEGRTVAVDVQTHGASWALVVVLVAAMAAMAVVLVGGCLNDPGGCSSRRPTEPLPSGEAARRWRGGETTP
jgi:hypothetical protein